MRCGEAVAVSSFTKHEKEGGCIRRAVPCVACGEFCFADELKEHEVCLREVYSVGWSGLKGGHLNGASIKKHY